MVNLSWCLIVLLFHNQLAMERCPFLKGTKNKIQSNHPPSDEEEKNPTEEKNNAHSRTKTKSADVPKVSKTKKQTPKDEKEPASSNNLLSINVNSSELDGSNFSSSSRSSSGSSSTPSRSNTLSVSSSPPILYNDLIAQIDFKYHKEFFNLLNQRPKGPWDLGIIKESFNKIYSAQSDVILKYQKTYQRTLTVNRNIFAAFSYNEIKDMKYSQFMQRCKYDHRYFFDIFGILWKSNDEGFSKYFSFLKHKVKHINSPMFKPSTSDTVNVTKDFEPLKQMWKETILPIVKILKEVLGKSCNEYKEPKRSH